MYKREPFHSERRWALAYNFGNRPTDPEDRIRYLGKYCFGDGAREEEPRVKTFTTRQQARDASKLLNQVSWKGVRVVRVNVKIDENPYPRKALKCKE